MKKIILVLLLVLSGCASEKVDEPKEDVEPIKEVEETIEEQPTQEEHHKAWFVEDKGDGSEDYYECLKIGTDIEEGNYHIVHTYKDKEPSEQRIIFVWILDAEVEISELENTTENVMLGGMEDCEADIELKEGQFLYVEIVKQRNPMCFGSLTLVKE